MERRTPDNRKLEDFQNHLIYEERSSATVEKYLRDVRAFFVFLGERELVKEEMVQYKKHLQEQGYAVRSVNSMLAGVHNYLDFAEISECKVKILKVQKETYSAQEKELTMAEYKRLVHAAERNERMKFVIETICATGIRVSELRYFTIEAVKQGEVIVQCKNKIRKIFIPKSLKKLLIKYARKRNIKSGPVFITRGKKPLDRSYIWAQMKKLCAAAGINPKKVFPHNLRKLFARTFYGKDKDIAKLADLLGHSSIETTRIYIMTTGYEHRRQIELLGLVV